MTCLESCFAKAADPGFDSPCGSKSSLRDCGVPQYAQEAQRTLHSLSRAYQEGIEDLDYEVIVVENGSSPDQALGEELVRSSARSSSI
jgi:hypothetical protein